MVNIYIKYKQIKAYEQTRKDNAKFRILRSARLFLLSLTLLISSVSNTYTLLALCDLKNEIQFRNKCTKEVTGIRHFITIIIIIIDAIIAAANATESAASNDSNADFHSFSVHNALRHILSFAKSILC